MSETGKTVETKMQKALDALKITLGKIRTGRAHTGILDHIMVDYYGSMVPVNQVSNLSLADARTINIQIWEKPMVGKIEKAIRDSDLGLNPATHGDSIRVMMPPLTEQRRKELIKLVKAEGETGKVALRNIRREANEQLKRMLKDKNINEDDEHRGQDEIQKLTDKYTAEIDKLLQAKEADLMVI